MLEWIQLWQVKGAANTSFTHYLPSHTRLGFPYRVSLLSAHVKTSISPMRQRYFPTLHADSHQRWQSALAFNYFISLNLVKAIFASFRYSAWPELYDWHHIIKNLLPFSILQFVCILQQEILSPNSTHFCTFQINLLAILTSWAWSVYLAG